MKSRQASADATSSAPPNRLAGTWDGAHRLERLTRAEQGLGRDAAPVRALPAEQLPLHDGDAQTSRGDGGRAVLPGCSAPENDRVIAGGHRALLARFLDDACMDDDLAVAQLLAPG